MELTTEVAQVPVEAQVTDSSYYVYALKDPRSSPAKPFYIGKGTGVRAYDHLVRPDESRKAQRIKEIHESGHKVLVSTMVDSLTEEQAIRLEAELISAFGTEATGGILTNAVVPTGLGRKIRRSIVIPHGARERAQLGLNLLKQAVLEFAKANAHGITNSDAASVLGLRSDYGGGSKDYLSYSIIGLLMREGKLARDGDSKRHVAQVR